MCTRRDVGGETVQVIISVICVGGERDVRPPAPEAPPQAGAVSRSVSAESARVDTADCFEIEDLDDAGWELVATPAEPLPNGTFSL